MKQILALTVLALALSACSDFSLKTRDDLRSGESPKKGDGAKAVKIEPTAAEKAEEADAQMRNLNGRVDDVENHFAQINTNMQEIKDQQAKRDKDADQKVAALEEAVKKLDAQVQALTEQVNKPKPPPPPADPKSVITEGDGLVKAKRYKEAIVAYQRYRDNFPKGKQYAEVTYKIGACFQDLGMKDEAKAFFEEIVTKHPKAAEAKLAARRLKKLK